MSDSGHTERVFKTLFNYDVKTQWGNAKFKVFSFWTDNTLQKVTFGDNSVITIGEFAFACNKLKEVTIPNSVEIIENGAFRDNELTKVELSKSVIAIGPCAFSCNKLKQVTIPKSVATIGGSAFQKYWPGIEDKEKDEEEEYLKEVIFTQV